MSDDVGTSISNLLSEMAPEPGQSIMKLVHKTVEILDYPSAFYAVLDERTQSAVLRVVKNLPPAGSAENISLRLLCYKIISSGGGSSQPVCFHLKAGDHVIGRLGFQAFLGFPVCSAAGQPIGLIAGLDTHKRGFAAAESTLLECCARLIALEDARRRREMELESTISALIRFQGYRFLKTQSWAPDWIRGDIYQLTFDRIPDAGFQLGLKFPF
jgi:hypothetical protein